MNVFGTLVSIKADRQTTQARVHVTPGDQSSVGIRSAKRGLIDARVRFKIQQANAPTTPDTMAGSFMHVRIPFDIDGPLAMM